MKGMHKLTIAGLLAMSTVSMAEGWQGSVALESRFFLDDATAGQSDEQFSLVFQPEYYQTGDDGSLFSFKALMRVDSMDSERTHADIRELSWIEVGDGWEVRAGISKVFWGVAESQHLVDIINQVDAVENIDAEDRMGQPMVNARWYVGDGTLELFMLPYFRERTFAGEDGRFRGPFVINTDRATYASGEGQRHVDWAVRWSETFGDWDVGLAHFAGTSREPILVPAFGSAGIELHPHYTTIDQTSIDVQATLDEWLWKLELMTNTGFDEGRYTAAVGGFEYSFFDINGSGIDVGVILEHQFDDRKQDIMGTPKPGVWVVGSRLAFNDVQSTELLVGLSVLESSGGKFWNIEASRRIGDHWKLTLEGRILSGVSDSDPLESPFYPVRNDSFIMLELGYFY